MKKAQIQSQMFIYIFAIVILSMILVFGVRSISKFKGDTEKVALINFQTELNSELLSITSIYDSIQKVTIDLPKDYTQVYIREKGNLVSGPGAAIVNEYKNSDSNVFIIKNGKYLEKDFKAGKNVTVAGASQFLLLQNTNGKISFMVKGKGKYAEISALPP